MFNKKIKKTQWQKKYYASEKEQLVESQTQRRQHYNEGLVQVKLGFMLM